MSTNQPTHLPIPSLPPLHRHRAQTSTLYLSARILIPTSAAHAFSILASPADYHAWNSFVPSATVKSSQRDRASRDGDHSGRGDDVLALTPLRNGDEVALHVRMKPADSDAKLQKMELVVKDVSMWPPRGTETETEEAPRQAEDLGFEHLSGGRKTYRLVWGSPEPSRMLRAERVMEVREVAAPERREGVSGESGGVGTGEQEQGADQGDGGDGGAWCEFRTWEVMSGPLAYAVKWMFGQTLRERFCDFARDLRKRSLEVGRGAA